MRAPKSDRERQRRESVRRAVRALAWAVAPLWGLAEGITRLLLRWRTGSWQRTLCGRVDDQKRASTRLLFRPHPFLNLAPREGGRFVVQRATMTVQGEGPGKVLMSFNSLGYRSPERARERAPGVRRVVCAGSSTTMDTLALNDANAWPNGLERKLREGGVDVEVWNAGVPGWTSLECLISLAIRDIELAPEVILLHAGVSDLQPLAHEPFDPHYVAGHAELARRAMGFGLPPLPLADRSLALERLEALLCGPERVGWKPLSEEPIAVRRELSARAIATFERNLRSFIALAAVHGARVLLLTQMVRIRREMAADDRAYMAWWVPGLEPEATASQVDRLNAVIHRLGAEGVAQVVDVAAGIPWRDEDFGDPFHLIAHDRFLTFVAREVAAALGEPRGAAAAPGILQEPREAVDLPA